MKSAPRLLQRRTRPLLVAGLCLVILRFAFSSGYNAPGIPMDEGIVLVYPELVQHGAVPYRDFETVYGPGNWWFLSGVYAIFGTNIYVERTVGLLYRVVCLLSIFALTRRWRLTVAAACLLLAGSLLINTGIVALSWWGAMACAVSALALCVADPTPWRCLGAGFLAGLAILFRVDVAPALCLAALPILWKLNWSRRLLLSGAAGVTAIAPLLAIAYVAGAGLVLNDLFFLPVLQSSPGRNLPFDRAKMVPTSLCEWSRMTSFLSESTALSNSSAAKLKSTSGLESLDRGRLETLKICRHISMKHFAAFAVQ